MDFKEFQGKNKFSREDIVAFAQGRLLADAPEGLGGIPCSLLLAFHEISHIFWDADAGTGRIEAIRRNRMDDWFYSCHFLGDPVMPGCWGIDAAWQCLKFFAAWRGLKGCDKTLGMENAAFFGQIRPYDQTIVYSVDILSIETIDGETLVTGKASVSVDGTQVYSIGNVCVATSYWASDAPTPLPAIGPAQDAPLKRLAYDEFSAKDRFSRAEIVALSQGRLVDAPQLEVGLLPSALMLEIGRVDRLRFDEAAGEGSISASRDNDPLEWFYPMTPGIKPAVLSIDAIWQLLGVFLTWRQNSGTGRALGFERVDVFGDITPEDRLVRYEVDILRTTRSEINGDAFVRADAKVYADGRLILACTNANVGCHKRIRYDDYPLPGEMSRGGKLKVRGGS